MRCDDKKRVFIDMDGVLCDNHPDDTLEEMRTPGYFRALLPRTSMVQSVKELLRDDSLEVFILSAVFSDTADWSVGEKNSWLDEYLPEIDRAHRLFTFCGQNKADAVGEIGVTDILCDDHSPNLTQWVHSGGKGIKILNEYNGKNGSFRAGPRINPQVYALLSQIVHCA